MQPPNTIITRYRRNFVEPRLLAHIWARANLKSIGLPSAGYPGFISLQQNEAEIQELIRSAKILLDSRRPGLDEHADLLTRSAAHTKRLAEAALIRLAAIKQD